MTRQERRAKRANYRQSVAMAKPNTLAKFGKTTFIVWSTAWATEEQPAQFAHVAESGAGWQAEFINKKGRLDWISDTFETLEELKEAVGIY